MIAIAVITVSIATGLRAMGLIGQGAPPEPDRTNEPAVGTPIDSDAFGDSSSGYLVIALGECSGCSAKRTDFRAIHDLGWEAVVFVVEGSPEDIASHAELAVAKEVGVVIADTDAHLSKLLNVLWTPRWYILSNERRLVAMQTQHADAYPRFIDWKPRVTK